MAEETASKVSLVETESDFFRFLLNASHKQAILLLKNLTERQTNSIGEVFQNILYSEEIAQDLVRSLKKQKNIVRKVGEKSSSVRKRKSVITKHPLTVLRILKHVEDILPV